MTDTTILSGMVLAQADGASPPPVSGDGTTEAVGNGGGAPAERSGATGGQFNGILMIALMFVVFYFLLIRPQQKKAKEHQKMLETITKGTEVVTNGGIVGRIVSDQGPILSLEVGDKVRVRVLRSQIAGTLDSLTPKDNKTAKADKTSEKK